MSCTLNSLRQSDGNLTIIASDYGLSPVRPQAIIWTNAGILLIGPLRTNFNEILIGIQILSFKKMHLKTSSGKWWPFCLSLNVLTLQVFLITLGPSGWYQQDVELKVFPIWHCLFSTFKEYLHYGQTQILHMYQIMSNWTPVYIVHNLPLCFPNN